MVYSTQASKTKVVTKVISRTCRCQISLLQAPSFSYQRYHTPIYEGESHQESPKGGKTPPRLSSKVWIAVSANSPHMEYVHTPIFYSCDTCGTRTKTLEALSFYTERRHSSDSTNNPEIEDNDHSKKIEELKVKLVHSRTIDGLETTDQRVEFGLPK